MERIASDPQSQRGHHRCSAERSAYIARRAQYSSSTSEHVERQEGTALIAESLGGTSESSAQEGEAVYARPRKWIPAVCLSRWKTFLF